MHKPITDEAIATARKMRAAGEKWSVISLVTGHPGIHSAVRNRDLGLTKGSGRGKWACRYCKGIISCRAFFCKHCRKVTQVGKEAGW